MVLFALFACSPTPTAPASVKDTAADPAAVDSGDTAADDTGPDDSGEPDDTGPDDSGEPDDTGPVQEPVIARFVALGDAGEGNDTQYRVADVIKTVCDAQGCDFALYLGDNFYDTGVEGPEDDQFETKFELPYAELDFPFYVVLGNHDYGGDGAGYEFWKGDYQVEYTAYSDKWTLPNAFYSHELGELELFGLDTNTIFWGFGDEQAAWLPGALATSDARWKIAFGHHCYLSNGQHGNAGEYEGFEWLPVANGAAVEEFVDANVCGQADVYFAGHDHLREWMGESCGTEFIVSGAGAKTTDLVGRGNTTEFESDVAGFVWVELRGDTATVQFWDENGNKDHEGSFTR